MEIIQGFNASYPVAFVIGLFSSFHCLGMCGSIIGTLTLSLKPDIRKTTSTLFPYVFSYNFGRISSYAIGGLLVGLVHHVVTIPFGREYGFRFLQISSALFMAGAGLYIAGWFPRFAYIEKVGGLFWKTIEPLGRRLIPVDSLPQAYLFGMVWGWLPCGLVYAALALAATTGSVQRSALTMLAFGFGTLPAVMSLGIMTSLLSKLATNRRFKQVAGTVLIVIAIFAAFPQLYPLQIHSM